MGKVSRHIQFPEKLDLRPYMSIRQVNNANVQLPELIGCFLL